MKKIPTNGMSHERLQVALLDVQDRLDRASIPFVVVDYTAEQIRQELPHLTLDKISIGVERKHLTHTCFSILKGLIPKLETKGNTLYYEVNNVPIVIRIIERHYKVLERPDVRFYYLGEFRIPNPFDKYWKIKDFLA